MSGVHTLDAIMDWRDSMKEQELHEKEKRLLEFIRQLGHGELVIKVQDGLPVLIEEGIKKVKL